MSTKSAAARQTFADNPLEGEQLLLDALFGNNAAAPKRPQAVTREAQEKPQHYKIVSISLYNEDIERLDDMVRELKKRGHYKANKSQLIRYALLKLNLDDMPKEV